MKREIEEAQYKFSEDDMGDEKVNAVGDLYEMFNDTIDTLGAAYGSFLKEFGHEIPEEVLTVIVQIASQMLKAGTNSTPSISVTN